MAATTASPIDTGIALTGAQETLLITLLSKRNDFYQPRPLLADHWAVAILDHLGPAQHAAVEARIPPGPILHPAWFGLRSRTIDEWAADFLDRHAGQPVAVLHLACGLDARALRLRDRCRGRDVRWTDLDLPAVIHARRRVAVAMPEPEPDEGYTYSMVSADVTTTDWLEALPDDRPTLVIMEGLSMYLGVEDGPALLRRLVDCFAPCGGELVLDAISAPSAALFNWLFKAKSDFDVHFAYTADNSDDVSKLDPRLQLVEGCSLVNNPGVRLLTFWLCWMFWFVSWIPYARGMSHYMHFKMQE
ncbi:O-methyltransferase-like protein [Cordyceps fumosorosea ARSEF 2679]|uniref:O-methyltransferase-like protein n=1 Tax=Cordyceps fumosorosea (strain ARSEF 2679) TaxID=1081104 RepID=A0A167M7S2_CORFA|nr:O-methyltransferase-like protein [Cordyceps fumosorosea ARSEF 2679]OAA54041.1 O-methyltransferase-like protein [Cordyceps fumosorosea ARSEF 2679]